MSSLRFRGLGLLGAAVAAGMPYMPTLERARALAGWAPPSFRSGNRYNPKRIKHADPADFREGSIERQIVQAAADKRARKALRLRAAL